MKIRHIVILLLLASAVLPLYYHRQMRKLYLDAYYRTYRKMDAEKALDHGRKLLRDEKYGRLVDFLDDMLLLYPADRDLRRLKGSALIKTGKTHEGARLVIASLGEREDLRTLSSIVEALFESAEYGDLAALFSRHGTSGDPYLSYVYGVSLYRTGRAREARDMLAAALNAGKRDGDTRYYLGLSHEAVGENKKAAENLEEAYAINPLKPAVRSALVRLYRKTGEYDKAEKIIRRSLR